MLTTRNTVNSKRDLHIGGTGAGASTALATMGAEWGERTTAHELLRDAQRNARQLLRQNPLAVVGLAAALGVTAGYFLARRF